MFCFLFLDNHTMKLLIFVGAFALVLSKSVHTRQWGAAIMANHKRFPKKLPGANNSLFVHE